MKRKLLLPLGIVFALTLPTWANNGKTMSFRTEVNLNNSKLNAGFYEITWVSHSPEATVTFARAGQVLATAKGRWVERGAKYTSDSVVYTNNPDGTHTLLELRFAGRKQALVFTNVN